MAPGSGYVLVARVGAPGTQGWDLICWKCEQEVWTLPLGSSSWLPSLDGKERNANLPENPFLAPSILGMSSGKDIRVL